MNKAMLETRKKLFKEKMDEPDYLISSYDKQKIQHDSIKYVDVRKRVQ